MWRQPYSACHLSFLHILLAPHSSATDIRPSSSPTCLENAKTIEIIWGFFEYKVHEGIGRHTWSSTTMCDLSTPPLALLQSCSPLHPQLSLCPPILFPVLPHCGHKDKQVAAMVQHVLGSCLHTRAPSWQSSPHSPGEAVKVSSHVTASPYCCADCSSLGHAPFTCCDFTLWTF